MEAPFFNPNVVPVEYNEIVRWISQDQPVLIPKLGRIVRNGRVCHFWCSVTNQEIMVSANRDGTISAFRYNSQRWNELCDIMRQVIADGGNPEFTYWYTNDPHYSNYSSNVPRRFGPNVPAICRSYNECNMINPIQNNNYIN